MKSVTVVFTFDGLLVCEVQSLIRRPAFTEDATRAYDKPRMHRVFASLGITIVIKIRHVSECSLRTHAQSHIYMALHMPLLAAALSQR